MNFISKVRQSNEFEGNAHTIALLKKPFSKAVEALGLLEKGQ